MANTNLEIVKPVIKLYQQEIFGIRKVLCLWVWLAVVLTAKAIL